MTLFSARKDLAISATLLVLNLACAIASDSGFNWYVSGVMTVVALFDFRTWLRSR